MSAPIRYAYRSFDRQWIIPDGRLINQPNPTLWGLRSNRQVFITAPHDRSPSNGPALTFSDLIPDLHHYSGRGGRAFPLWADSAAIQSNLSPKLLELLSLRYGKPVTPEDIFAYIAGIAANPTYTAKFQAELTTPGLRIPFTADANTFNAVVAVGRRVIWLHSYGERMADPKQGRPAGSPRVATATRPTVPKGGAIPPTAELPANLRYAALEQRLYLGDGYIDHVAQSAWAYEVDGKQVVPQWFSYRKRDRSKPPMGDKRPPSPLQYIQPEHWLAEYTADLLDLLNILTLLVELEPEQTKLLDEVCDGELISQAELQIAGAIGPFTAVAKGSKEKDEKQAELFYPP